MNIERYYGQPVFEGNLTELSDRVTYAISLGVLAQHKLSLIERSFLVNDFNSRMAQYQEDFSNYEIDLAIYNAELDIYVNELSIWIDADVETRGEQPTPPIRPIEPESPTPFFAKDSMDKIELVSKGSEYWKKAIILIKNLSFDPYITDAIKMAMVTVLTSQVNNLTNIRSQQDSVIDLINALKVGSWSDVGADDEIAGGPPSPFVRALLLQTMSIFTTEFIKISLNLVSDSLTEGTLAPYSSYFELDTNITLTPEESQMLEYAKTQLPVLVKIVLAQTFSLQSYGINFGYGYGYSTTYGYGYDYNFEFALGLNYFEVLM